MVTMMNVVPMTVTMFDIAQRFIGVRETAGSMSNPHIMAMLTLDASWPQNDDVPWCSAFMNYCAWLLRLPRSKDLRARSWLNVGVPVTPIYASVGFDVVVLNRQNGPSDPNVIDAPGHVGLFAGLSGLNGVHILGGNQGDSVCVSEYPQTSILGVRRLR